MIGEVSLPPYNSGDSFSVTQKKCTEYAAARGLEDLARNGHVSSPTTLQAYIDECGRQIDSQRQTRQLMVMGSLLAGAGAVWWLWSQR